MIATIPDWINNLTPQELSDAAIRLQLDASYLYRWAGIYRDGRAHSVAVRAQMAARRSYDLSKLCIYAARQRGGVCLPRKGDG
ncbi:hypothetical protein [Uliginosibacterium sediminicola]|uniref:Transposase n=1 Tax=Uliginosibacterium sediminicola TaxID=2024550 RepID=A0ABU9YVY2_9RHOO